MKKQLTFLLLASALMIGACSHQRCHHCTDGKGQNHASCSHEQTGEHFSKTPAYFEFDSYTLDSQDKEHLKKIAKHLRNEPNKKVRLAGYTDSIGTDAYNMNLSRERAQAAADYLESLGIDSNRISIQSYGASRYADTNDTSAGRALNRRVEATFMK